MLSSEFVAAVLSDDAFEVVHGEEIGVVPAGSLESNRETGVKHLVVALIEQGGGEEGTVAVGHFGTAEGRDWAEVGSDLSGEVFAVDVTGTTDDDVASNVEVVVVLFDLFGGDWVDDVLVSEGGLSEIVVLSGVGVTLKEV